MAQNRSASTKRASQPVFTADPQWRVWSGRLVPGRGRPHKVQHLFKVVAEKIPFTALDAVKKDLLASGMTSDGVYVAHDSMGYARYVGRGDIFNRLKARKKAQKLELVYMIAMLRGEKCKEITPPSSSSLVRGGLAGLKKFRASTARKELAMS